ncbi:hypothetical protein [Ruicaihuangia caeni]|uniref:CPXCG motif-containing cysteine-rich protein n=1 Tax=Ruicaihuangia caeni TaxID=3042517 RepID=A0AAW6TB35_9MICO|nr:hypothetical protein [Klugiella sp. YN-L-19]MDI2098802.1 hypothetical protein [Klugiella sp. YN-L-19]
MGSDAEYETDAGDPACWLDLVCPACGRVIEEYPHECLAAR